MSKPEWGTKRICPACNTKFYDLKRVPIFCPNCDLEYKEPVQTNRRGRVAKTGKVKPKITENISTIKKPATESNELDNEIEEFESDDNILEPPLVDDEEDEGNDVSNEIDTIPNKGKSELI